MLKTAGGSRRILFRLACGRASLGGGLLDEVGHGCRLRSTYIAWLPATSTTVEPALASRAGPVGGSSGLRSRRGTSLVCSARQAR